MMKFYQEELREICNKISKGTGLTPYEVLRIGRSAYYRYKKYKIPKKKAGEFRWVGQPAKEVKLLQWWIIENLLKDLRVHKCATAYMKGSSIKKNAIVHIKNSYILKLDFINFFPSIAPRDFTRHFKKYGKFDLSENELFFLSKILFWKENRTSDLSLIIGAPSSPILSNTIMYDFDNEVYLFCKEKNMKYTRYADDICISSSKKNTKVAYDFIKNLLLKLEYPRLELNDDKTLFLSKSGKRRITGIVINNEQELSLGRNKKRELSSRVHYYINNKLNSREIHELRGLLAFAKDIEPKFIDRLAIKYGKEVLLKLLPGKDQYQN